MSFVPVKGGNRILLFAKYFEKTTYKAYLHLSIREIRSDNRVGRALWSFNGSVDGHFDNDNLDATILVETRRVRLIAQSKLADATLQYLSLAIEYSEEFTTTVETEDIITPPPSIHPLTRDIGSLPR